MGAGADRSRVVIVDDDDDLRRILRARFEGAGLEVIQAVSGEDALQVIDDSVDLVIVDVGLPGIDGFAVVRRLRERFNMPIVMLTGSAEESDRVLGLEIGADDYVVKPFLPRELHARVLAHLRRSAGMTRPSDPSRDLIRFGRISVNPAAREVQVEGELQAVTNREFDLLAFLATSPRQVFSRDQLLRSVWGSEPGWQNSATVTEHVRRLRKLVEVDPSSPLHLVTVRGAGYRLDP